MKGRTSLLFSLIIVVYSYGVASQGTTCENATMADIVFLVNGSTNVNLENARPFLRSAIKALDIGPNKVRIGLAQYSDNPYQEFLLKDHMDKKSLLAAVEKYPYRRGGTETGKAIDFLRTQYFTEQAGSRASKGVPQIAVVITDGNSSDDVREPAQRLRMHERGVIVFGIGVGKANLEKLQSIANWPNDRFMFPMNSYEALQSLRESVLQTVCVSIEDQRQALDKFADIFYLVDSGISPGQLGMFKSELTKSITQHNVGASTYRIGLAQYGQDIQIEFLLNKFQNKQQTLAGVKRFRLLPQPNKPRNLGSALQYAKKNLFTLEAGGRAHLGYNQFLVVVSGKESDDSVSIVAREVQSEGVTIVGISAGAPMDAIYLFASPRFAFDSITESALSTFFTADKVEVITDDCKGANVADIVFIVDESGSIGTLSFSLVRTFLHSIVSGLNVGLSNVRVGIVTYSDAPKAHVYLDTFNDRNEILQFINILPHRGGGTNTGAALNFTRKEIFNEKRGSRRGVSSVVVVITDGKSQDDVSAPALSLRRAGVTIFAVGIEDANKAELVKMVNHPPYKHIFSVDSFTRLKPLKQKLLKTLCNNIIHQAITAGMRERNAKEACVQKDEADIFFLIDDSGSIENEDFSDMKNFIIEFIETFRIGPQHVRMGLVKYADVPTLEFDLTTHTDAGKLKKVVEGIIHKGGGTNTGKALKSMEPYFKRARGQNIPEYLIVITDGKSQDKVKTPADTLRAQGVIIYAIGVKNSSETELLEIAGDPKRNFTVNNFDALQSIKSDIITDICSPDVCKDTPGDLLFLIDSSGSIKSEEYKKMKDFMKSAISKFVVGQNKVHVGVMEFSTEQRLAFSLNKFYSKEEMSNAINDMQQLGGGTHTGKAITEVSQYFDAARGGRRNTTQSLVVITDGESQDEVKEPAVALRAKGVVVYAIGVLAANRTQLLEISGSLERMYDEKDFDALKDLESQVALKICEKQSVCVTEKADIIFLVDMSSTIDATEFKSMQKFMELVVNETIVDKDRTRFGVILYSTDSQSIFTLKDYNSKREVLKAITDLSATGGDTYTGEALEYSLEFFKAKHGGRKELKVPQILMVITDGDATDPDKLKEPSDALRKNGVSVFSIGVKDANRDQLVTMAGGDTSRVFYVDSYVALEALYNNISSALCNTTVCEKNKADLVFLLDQSGSITGDNHKIMINFTAEVVNSFEVSKDFVHVGLAQFSDYPQPEFYLSKYSKKEDVTKHILSLNHSGGNTFIGKALVHIKDYFNVSLGHRSGISKNLVLITDGDSHDEVEDAADEVRALGIDVFVIGIGKVSDLKLLQIAGTQMKVFNVQDFNSLKDIKKNVVKAICKEQCDRPDCSIDIAMGFDISQRIGTPGERLVSGHTKLQTFLPKIVHYVSSVQGLSCVFPTPVEPNIAFHVVSQDGRSLFDTNFEGYSEDVVKKVMNEQKSEPTYFNTNLLKFFKEMFRTKSTASVKVLVIFSDGLDEDWMKLRHESDLLRQSGVSALLTVALEGVRDTAELQMVEFGRGFGYALPLSIGMPSIGSNILKQIDTVSESECCKVMCKCSGHEGIRGPPGIPGTKGSLGQMGHSGFLGEEGVAGERGPPGPSGPQGIEGCPGPRGQKGNRGVSGNRGENGEDGLEAVDGEQGLTGPGGAQGERGNPGNPGIPGIRGEAGVKGERGLRGDPGEPGVDNTTPGAKGSPGNPGLPGPPGQDGQPGERGLIGNQGPDGRRGAIGEKGEPGQPGARGLPGSPGASGPQGRRGENGDRGPKGFPGFPGPQGEPGLTGDPGLAGRRGANGQKGQPGDPGIKGSPGSQGPRGMSGQDGIDGYGPPGSKGAKGDPGFPGYPGLPGEDGLRGSKGYPGRKGNQGRGGNSGRSGEPGGPGETGDPGHRGLRGPPGGKDMTECQLIGYIRENCACSTGRSECPAYPTELVFGLDMSEDVTPTAFERQRSALLSLLEDITIAESNCPTGARIAVVGYSAYTKYLIRFNDYRHKKQLIESVKNIALERTSNRRQLGAGMRFVGQNVFKRVRGGMMMRKVAVFFSNGPSSDSSNIVTAAMEYRARNIFPAVISLRNAPATERALEVDDTRNSIFTVLGRNMAADLKNVKACAICYDPCRRSDECSLIQDPPKPQEVNLDLVMVVDSSREMQADEYAGAQQLLGSVVEQLAVSPTPRRASNKARVAVVQQSRTQVYKAEFGLQAYQTSTLMKSHLIQKMQQQSGSSALGRALEFSLREVLLRASQPNRKKAMLTVVGTQTAYEDRAMLHYISQKAKCEGVALFVVTVGERYNRTQVEELASLPVQQHLIHVGRLKADEQGYVQRFFRVFLSALNKGTNSYPPASFRQTCSQLTDQDYPQVLRLFADEKFQKQMGGKIRTTQLDVIDTLTTGGGQSSLSGAYLNDPKILPKPELTSSASRDTCFLRQDVGDCSSYTLVWFFDSDQNKCSNFWYGGCGGNKNRFKTKKDCETLCLSP